MAFSRPFKMQTLGAIPQKLSRRRETMLTGYARRSCSLKCKFDLIKTAIFDRCFFAFLSVPRTFELLFHGRNTLLNHVFLINDSVNICLFSKSGNSLIILFIYKNSELYQHFRDAGAALFSYMPYSISERRCPS